MHTLMLAGVGLFIVGLLLNHVVLLITRKPLRAGEHITKKQKGLMWLAITLTVVGLVLSGVGFFSGAG